MDPEEDVSRIFAIQTGRDPAIAFEVVRECPFGWPAVIRCEPYSSSGEPNPNIFYLTCPHLVRKISRLEDGGAIARLQERLESDAELKANLRAVQDRHRVAWLRAADSEDGPNIAASRGRTKLKCLHAHAAWALVHGDHDTGSMILELCDGLWCRDEHCRKLIDQERGKREKTPGRGA